MTARRRARSCCARPGSPRGISTIPTASEQLWAGGYLHTSDIAAVTPEGYVQITDRIKDVIKTGGEWVSSLQIEDLITHCAGVAEAAVIGVKDDKWGERPMALVVKDASGARLSLTADIKAHLKVFADEGDHLEIRHSRRKSCSSKACPKRASARSTRRSFAQKYGDM